MPRLFEDLGLARLDGRFPRRIDKLARVPLLILDDWGTHTLTDQQRLDLLEIFEERYRRKSTLITAQLPVAQWHNMIGEPTIADAILDRIIHNAHRITLEGEAAGDPGPWQQQAIFGRGRWNADGLRDIVREYVVEHLATDDAVLVIDETGFFKQGKTSCGVSRQYTGLAGKITNCQIGVFTACMSGRGHACIDRALYFPKSWTGDPQGLLPLMFLKL